MTGSEWKAIPGFSRYEAAAHLQQDERGTSGQVRNAVTGRILATYLNRGYLAVKITDDSGKRRDPLVHRVVLLTYVGEPGPGEEACHLNDQSTDNRWPENLQWGTKAQNEAQKAANGNAAPPVPSYPCLNAPECDGNALHAGKRCARCVHEAGLDIDERLIRRENLAVIAAEYGFGVDWAWRLDRQHGGRYTGSKTDALRQQPPLSRRVMTRLRSRRVTPDGGDAA